MRFVNGGKVYDDQDQQAIYEAPYNGAQGFDKASLHQTGKGTIFMCVGMSEHPSIRRFYSAQAKDIHPFLEESKAPVSVYTMLGLELEEA